MAEFTLHIEGMHCGACVGRVSQALATEGLDVKEVRLGAARITSDQDPPPVDRALAVIQKAGYRARLDPASDASAPAE
jgi:copper chaperone